MQLQPSAAFYGLNPKVAKRNSRLARIEAPDKAASGLPEICAHPKLGKQKLSKTVQLGDRIKGKKYETAKCAKLQNYFWENVCICAQNS